MVMENTATVSATGKSSDAAGIAGLKILVMAGGRSSERDVSLASAAAVAKALSSAGAEVYAFDPGVSQHVVLWTPDFGTSDIGTVPPKALPGHVPTISPGDLRLGEFEEMNVVFNALHGGDGENGRLQALLDMSGIAYTGSGMLASALAMDKNMAKRVFVAEGIPTPAWMMFDNPKSFTYAEVEESLGTPLIVKPNAQGSTVGLTLVDKASLWDKALAAAFKWDDRVIVEEFIAGRELAAGVLGDQPLPVVEVKPKHGIYDYECKYTDGMTEYLCPATITAAQTRACKEQALEAFRVLGCKGYARADFRMTADGHLYCLEVNTLPGMTSHSLVPKAAKVAGIEFSDLVARICQLAIKR
jgi:D-alanine-D-alanine ligase